MARGLNNRIAKALAILSVVAMMDSPALADDGSVSLPQTGAEPVTVRLPAATPDEIDPAERLQVFVGVADPCCEGRTPMAGRYALTDDNLSFSPAFGFDPNQDYTARVRAGKNEHALYAFRLPHEVAPVPAAVTEVYPSGETIPENTLRFYVHFSTPMRPQVAFDYIKLRDASGTVDDAAFMQFTQELWDEDRTRLTVLIDPGRIKREVATNVELGPALLAEQNYTLSIEGGWPSADGNSTLSTYTKTFHVSDALRTRPDARLWKVNAPCSGTREALKVTLDRPFDRHLLAHALRIETGSGDEVEGLVEVKEAEHAWSLKPLEPWPAEDLLLLTNPTLEDVAGNNFRDLLDHVAGQEESDTAVSEVPIRARNCSD